MAFNGTWTVCGNDNLKAVADVLGVDQAKRDPAKLAGATLIIKQDGDNFTTTATGGLGNSVSSSFTVGSTHNGDILGKAFQAETSWDGDTVVAKGTGDKGVVLKRYIEGDKFVLQIEAGGQVGKIFFSK